LLLIFIANIWCKKDRKIESMPKPDKNASKVQSDSKDTKDTKDASKKGKSGKEEKGKLTPETKEKGGYIALVF
jgi:hypothetical protein